MGDRLGPTGIDVTVVVLGSGGSAVQRLRRYQAAASWRGLRGGAARAACWRSGLWLDAGDAGSAGGSGAASTWSTWSGQWRMEPGDK